MELKKRLREALSWTNASVSHTVGVCFVALFIMLLGIYVLGAPGRLRESAILSAQAEIDIANAAYRQTLIDFQPITEWFKPEYWQEYQTQLHAVRATLSSENEQGAAYQLAVAQDTSNWREARAIAQQAEQQATEATQKIEGVSSKIDELLNLRDSARSELLRLQRQNADANLLLNSGRKMFRSQESQYLTKYMEPLAQDIENAEEKLQQVTQHSSIAVAALPPNSDQSQSGDPNVAIEEIDVATALIVEIETHMAKVTAGLEYQLMAKRAVLGTGQKSILTSTQESIQNAWMKLENIRVNRGYSYGKALYEAMQLYLRASSEQQIAIQTAETLVAGENLIDFPLAYELAINATTLATQCVVEVDKQVWFADQTDALLKQFQTELFVVQNTIASAASSQLVLENFHNHSTWDDLRGNVASARSQVAIAETLAVTARNQSSLTSQEFSAAKTSAEGALNTIAAAKSSAQAVITRSSALEAYRSDWPYALSSAESAIEAAESRIDSLNWQYDMSRAQAELTFAKSQFTTAQYSAVNGFWENAVSQAQSAELNAEYALSYANQDKNSQDTEATRVSAAATRAQQDEYDAATRSAQVFEDDDDDWSIPSGSDSSWPSDDSGSSTDDFGDGWTTDDSIGGGNDGWSTDDGFDFLTLKLLRGILCLHCSE